MYQEFTRIRFPFDVIEEEEGYRILAEMPGIENEDMEIQVKYDSIEIKIKIEEDEETRFIHRERPHGEFVRRLSFGKPINPKEATSQLNDGILEIFLPYNEIAKKVTLLIS